MNESRGLAINFHSEFDKGLAMFRFSFTIPGKTTIQQPTNVIFYEHLVTIFFLESFHWEYEDSVAGQLGLTNIQISEV